ncbi:MAG: hypothetical protein GX044_04755 [Firmicutes bacterium]|nr:hypothetical protein [Bacillota bacterium]
MAKGSKDAQDAAKHDGFFNDLLEIQKLLWKNDDLMEQETLFELQDKVSELALKMAGDNPLKQDLLLREFPWLYKKKS